MFRDALIHLTFLAVLCVATPQGRADAPIPVTGPWITLGDVADASGPLAKVRVAPSPDPGQSLKLDPSFVGNIARSNGVYFDDNQTAPIEVIRQSREEMASATQPRINQNSAPSDEHILVLASDKRRGDVIQEADLLWEEVPANRLKPSGTPGMKSDVIGMELRRSIRAGASFRSSDVKKPSVIKKGDPVTLIYARGGLKLTVGGKATADAALGAPVRVLNNYSKRTIDAIASGSGIARVPG